MDIDESARGALADAFQRFCPSAEELVVPGGYRDSGMAVIDAVFSMRAHYTGARSVVDSYAKWAGVPDTPGLSAKRQDADRHSVSDLHARIAALEPTVAAQQVFANESRHSGRVKAALVRDAAQALTRAGVSRRQDVAMLPTDTAYPEQKAAWQSVHGLGPVTFEYFRMLCGAESSKPDAMVIGWLRSVLGQDFTWREALELMRVLRDELSTRWRREVSLRAVDHTVWRHHSGRL